MNKDKNDVVIVELDRPRELRFGHKALKKMYSLIGKNVDDMDSDDLGLEEVEQIYFYGLERDARDNGETLTLEMVEDILDHAPNYNYLIEKMNEALSSAMQGAGGNMSAPVGPAQNRTQRRGHGKKV